MGILSPFSVFPALRGGRWYRHPLLGSMLGVVVLLVGFVDGARGEVVQEQQIKVAYLYNFTQFIQWPESLFADHPGRFFLCVVGRDPFGSLLDVVSRKQVLDRQIVIRRLVEGEGVGHCQILFVSESEKERWALILADVGRRPILTVSDVEGFAQQGGMINFIRMGDKMRFEIHRERMDGSGLKVSSTLLRVGRIVHGDSKP